jgi:hypothetical protein
MAICPLWAATGEFTGQYPRVKLRPDVLYVDNGQLLTSAGAAPGLDLCLHMIRSDWGSAVAADAARLSVMPLEREGGQAQFIIRPQPPLPHGSELEALLSWMEEHLVVDAINYLPDRDGHVAELDDSTTSSELLHDRAELGRDAAYGGSMTTAWKHQPARKAVRRPRASRARRG